jgi:hypothetical protein
VRFRQRWSIARTRLTDFHRIRTLIDVPTRTLVLCGPRRQQWGFLTEDGFVEWDKVES